MMETWDFEGHYFSLNGMESLFFSRKIPPRARWTQVNGHKRREREREISFEWVKFTMERCCSSIRERDTVRVTQHIPLRRIIYNPILPCDIRGGERGGELFCCVAASSFVILGPYCVSQNLLFFSFVFRAQQWRWRKDTCKEESRRRTKLRTGSRNVEKKSLIS